MINLCLYKNQLNKYIIHINYNKIIRLISTNSNNSNNNNNNNDTLSSSSSSSSSPFYKHGILTQKYSQSKFQNYSFINNYNNIEKISNEEANKSVSIYNNDNKISYYTKFQNLIIGGGEYIFLHFLPKRYPSSVREGYLKFATGQSFALVFGIRIKCNNISFIYI
jgi:hypothetical protein